jgi:hypothetical protein
MFDGSVYPKNLMQTLVYLPVLAGLLQYSPMKRARRMLGASRALNAQAASAAWTLILLALQSIGKARCAAMCTTLGDFWGKEALLLSIWVCSMTTDFYQVSCRQEQATACVCDWLILPERRLRFRPFTAKSVYGILQYEIMQKV